MGGGGLNDLELTLIETMSSEGILKPPKIEFDESSSERFIFTPNPGHGRLNATKREIYERAMALVSSVRKGQLLPENYKIKYPLAILTALRDRGFIKSNSEASTQYKNLVFMKVAQLHEISPGRHQLKLIKTDENIEALNIAISLLQGSKLMDLEVNKEAQIAFSRDERYIQSIISSEQLRTVKSIDINEEAKHEMDQLLLNFGG